MTWHQSSRTGHRKSCHKRNPNDSHNQTTNSAADNITHLPPSLLLRRSAPLSSRTSYRRDMPPNWPSRIAPHTTQTIHTTKQPAPHPKTSHTPLAILTSTRRSPRERRVDVTWNRTSRTAHARTTHTNATYTTRTFETTTHAPRAALLLRRSAPLSRR